MYKINLLVTEVAVNKFLEEMSSNRDFELIDIKYNDYKYLVIYKI